LIGTAPTNSLPNLTVASETIEAVAFSQAVRALDAQTTALESLRTRAATILSAAALVTAFLGGLALAGLTLQNGEIQRAELTAWSWLGISSFLAVLLLSLVMLFPYRMPHSRARRASSRAPRPSLMPRSRRFSAI
jgi:MFS family permease